MIASDDDQGLVRASMAGNQEAFGLLVCRYQSRLYPTLLRLSGSHEDALDLLQDAFKRAYEKLGRFLGESSFYTWLYRIAVNLALSKKRRPGPACVPFSAVVQDEVASSNDDSDPAWPVEQAEIEELVQRALSQLQDDHRAVVVLKDLDGLRYEEIADILEIPIGTVRSRLHRARCELRERLRAVFEPVSGGLTARERQSVG